MRLAWTGFWIHRTLENANIESHVVDPASIATSRRRRRVKTDGVDGEALAWVLRPRGALTPSRYRAVGVAFGR